MKKLLAKVGKVVLVVGGVAAVVAGGLFLANSIAEEAAVDHTDPDAAADAGAETTAETSTAE